MFKETKWQYLYPFTNGAPLYTLSKVRMTEPYLCVVTVTTQADNSLKCFLAVFFRPLKC